MRNLISNYRWFAFYYIYVWVSMHFVWHAITARGWIELHRTMNVCLVTRFWSRRWIILRWFFAQTHSVWLSQRTWHTSPGPRFGSHSGHNPMLDNCSVCISHGKYSGSSRCVAVVAVQHVRRLHHHQSTRTDCWHVAHITHTQFHNGVQSRWLQSINLECRTHYNWNALNRSIYTFLFIEFSQKDIVLIVMCWHEQNTTDIWK